MILPLIGIIFIILGVWCILSPKSLVDMKIKLMKMVGAKLIVSKKTLVYVKYFGIVYLAIGILLLLPTLLVFP